VTQPNSHMRFPLDIPSSRLAERTKSTDDHIGRTKKDLRKGLLFIYCSGLIKAIQLLTINPSHY